MSRRPHRAGAHARSRQHPLRIASYHPSPVQVLSWRDTCCVTLPAAMSGAHPRMSISSITTSAGL
jgi:hypothetical protein